MREFEISLLLLSELMVAMSPSEGFHTCLFR